MVATRGLLRVVGPKDQMRGSARGGRASPVTAYRANPDIRIVTTVRINRTRPVTGLARIRLVTAHRLSMKVITAATPAAVRRRSQMAISSALTNCRPKN